MQENFCTLTLDEDTLVCRCLNFTEIEVIEITRIKKIGCLSELRLESDVGSGCTACHRKLKQIITEHGYKS